MSRLTLSPELTLSIKNLIAHFPVEAPRKLRGQVPYVYQHSALPVCFGWTETIGIRPNGEVIRWSTEGEFEGVRPIQERSLMLTAIVAGAKWYPELRPLLPVRGPEADECPCRAIPIFASGKVVCDQCGGLGWLPGDEWQP